MAHRLALFLFIGLLSILAATISISSERESPSSYKKALKPKKLIEWGWDEPDTKFLCKNVKKMEQLPFDGLVFHALSNKGENLSWEIWGSKKFTPNDFQQAIADLQATPRQRFTDLFLRVNVTPGNVDWFDDQAWATVVNNFGVAAYVAKQGHCKGFMFDTEQYDGVKDFDYRQQKYKNQKSFTEYQAKVRQRGREWIQAINLRYPDITILLTFAYEVTHWRAEKPKDRSTATYGLLADFLDGILEACTKETTLVDAWEFSYPYRERKEFEQAYETITQKALTLTAVPERYKTQVKAGFGIWMDHHRKSWDMTDFSKNYFTPDQFTATVRAALAVSDCYVWIYSERPRWWTNQMLPREYVEALVKARLEPR